MRSGLLEDIKSANDLEFIMKEIIGFWNDEQRRRNEFWNSVRDDQKAEFIQGEGVMYHSPVKYIHNIVKRNLLNLLLNYLNTKKIGSLGYEKMLIRLTRNDFEPDIVFWRNEKALKFTENQHVFPPADFIVEILSDSTAHIDRGLKYNDYELHGISEYWIIDPEQKSVEKYILVNGKYELSEKLKNGTIGSEVISGFQTEVSALFAE